MSQPTREHHDIESTKPEHSKDIGISGSISPTGAEGNQPPKRRITRSSTFRSLARPEITPSSITDGPRNSFDTPPRTYLPSVNDRKDMQEECQIMVTDFDARKLEIHAYETSASFLEALSEDRESWVKYRWINVNGRNWDIIDALRLKKGLHDFAIRDLVSDSKIAKTEWYADHVYIALTLQKLVHYTPKDEESEIEDILNPKAEKRRGVFSRLFHRNKVEENGRAELGSTTPEHKRPEPVTLQKYHGYKKEDGIAYMEMHSPLARKNFEVHTDRVSIFLTADNTVISFSRNSADDLASLVLPQLKQFNTLFRQSSDASVITQGIINAIIDLALPVTEAYRDAIGSLQLQVLTQPTLKHTSTLYIMTNEIEWIRSSVTPILNIIRTLRDHKNATITDGVGNGDPNEDQSMVGQSRVKISSAAQTYARDAEGKINLITESLDSIRTSGTTLIDLIFNTVSANQNESIKQLTVVTIVFLPMSFLASYFAVPFVDFSLSRHSQGFYWKITIPTAVAVILFLMGGRVKWVFGKLVQRRRIAKRRMEKQRDAAGAQNR